MPQSLADFCAIVSQDAELHHGVLAQIQLAGIGWHGIALGLWACLLLIAWLNRKRRKRVSNSSRRISFPILVCAFSFGVVSQLLVLLSKSGLVESKSWRSILPALELALHIIAMVLFAGGFIALLTRHKTADRPAFIRVGLVLACCVAAMWWWGHGLFVLAIALLGLSLIHI